jgi:hypothetical protein
VTKARQLPCAGAVQTLASGGTIMSSLEDAIKVSVALRGQKKYIEAIDLIQRALAAAPAEDFARLDANREGLRAAEQAGLPAVAKRFADAISIRDVEGDEDDKDA